MTTTTVKGWRRCRGCLRMRSVLDERDVCAVCAPRADAGEITLHAAGEAIPAAPVPAPVEPNVLADGSVVDDVHDPVMCEGACERRDPRCPGCPDVVRATTGTGNAPSEGWIAPNTPMTPEPKQRPVKRRWWRGRR